MRLFGPPIVIFSAKIITFPANSRQKQQPEYGLEILLGKWVSEMAYQIVAEWEGLTVRMEQHSILFALAKAQVFASKGWSIVVTRDGEVLYPPQEMADVAADYAPPLTPTEPSVVPDDEADAVTVPVIGDFALDSDD